MRRIFPYAARTWRSWLCGTATLILLAACASAPAPELAEEGKQGPAAADGEDGLGTPASALSRVEAPLAPAPRRAPDPPLPAAPAADKAPATGAVAQTTAQAPRPQATEPPAAAPAEPMPAAPARPLPTAAPAPSAPAEPLPAPADPAPFALRVAAEPIADNAAEETEAWQRIWREIVATTEAWAQAWSEQAVDDYLSFYSPGFASPDGLSRDRWEALRRQRLSGPSSIEVTIEVSEIQIDSPERARIRFRQRYRSNLYEDEVDKTLDLVREGMEWKILAETVTP